MPTCVRMAAAGARAFLVGESLMREPDVTARHPPPARRHRGMSGLTHFDAAGNAVMVDVGGKAVTERTATAEGRVMMAPETLALIAARGFKKGDVLGVAQLAGIMGAKRTADLIPLCHPLPLTAVTVELDAAARARLRRDPRHLQGDRPDRRRDGGADRGRGGGAHRLRHVQGGRPRHADRPTSGCVHKAGGRSGEFRAGA